VKPEPGGGPGRLLEAARRAPLTADACPYLSSQTTDRSWFR
jgi:hypothetical protein